MNPGIFRDRRDAGRKLAGMLGAFAKRPDVLVLALPRGGVPVALEVARTLEAPFDVFVVRKLGVPGYEELAMGAVGSGGVRVRPRSLSIQSWKSVSARSSERSSANGIGAWPPASAAATS